MEPLTDNNTRIYYSNVRKQKYQVYKHTGSRNSIDNYQANLKKKKSALNQFLTKLPEKLVYHNTLKPLRKICLDFVVSNFHLVDSLDGFPDIVGKELFEACVDIGYFLPDQSGNWCSILEIFLNTYKEEILKTLNLSEKWLFLSMHVDYLTPYQYLENIDLSHCRIGDAHDCLSLIGGFSHLRKLYLNNNYLSLNGIALLTQSHRRRHLGLEKLEVIRLDGNKEITSEIFPHLENLVALKVVVLNDNDSFKKTLTKQLKNCSTFAICPHSVLYHRKDWQRKFSANLGEGWAIPLIDSYIQKMEDDLEKRNLDASHIKKKPTFYSTTSKQKSVIKSLPDCAAVQSHLIFCKCVHQNPGCHKLTLKRKADNQVSSEVGPQPSKLKCQTTNSGTRVQANIDENILDLYR